MGNKHNEDILYGKPNSILIGDGVPNKQMTYRKGDMIINVGTKMEQEPIYICIESGTPGKWMAIQGGPSMNIITEEIKYVEEDVEVVNTSLVNLASSVYGQPAGSTLEPEIDYVEVVLPEDEEYIAAVKKLLANGKEVLPTIKISVGNNNFIEVDQYVFEGNICKVALPTLVINEQPFTVVTEGYNDLDFEIIMPDLISVEGVAYKAASYNKGEFSLEKVAEGEYNLVLNKKINIPSWASDGYGRALVLFDMLDKNGETIINKDSMFITGKIYDDTETLGITPSDNMLVDGEATKRYVLGSYVIVKDVPYDYEYKVVMLGTEYKFIKIIIHIPANKVD